ncbi:MAG TPA: sialidase family protein [Thermoanaerobaculia bacterium]
MHPTARALALLLALLSNVERSTAGERIVAGPPVAVSADRPEIPHFELSLAAHPTNPEILFGVAVTLPEDLSQRDLTATIVAGFRSPDGGRTWTRAAFPECRIDPWVTFGEGDAVFLSCMGKEGSPVLVYRSADAGRTWEGPVPVPLGGGKGVDRPVVVTGPGTVYVAFSLYSKVPGLPSSVYGPAVSRSTDGGRTFSEPVVLRHDTLTQQSFDAATLSGGGLVVPFMDFAVGDSALLAHRRTWIVRSDDGGRTFTLPALAREQIDREMPWSMAVDRSARHRDRLYLVVDGYWERNGGKPAPDRPLPLGGLFVLISDDRGATWRPAGRVSDAPPGANQETPVIAVNKEGIVGVAWYDTRHDPGGECFDLYFSASLDGGATFLPNVRITPETSCPQGSPKQRGVATRWRFGGDYSGLAAGADGRFHAFWADSRTGVYQVWWAEVRVNFDERSDP